MHCSCEMSPLIETGSFNRVQWLLRFRFITCLCIKLTQIHLHVPCNVFCEHIDQKPRCAALTIKLWEFWTPTSAKISRGAFIWLMHTEVSEGTMLVDFHALTMKHLNIPAKASQSYKLYLHQFYLWNSFWGLFSRLRDFPWEYWGFRLFCQ